MHNELSENRQKGGPEKDPLLFCIFDTLCLTNGNGDGIICERLRERSEQKRIEKKFEKT